MIRCRFQCNSKDPRPLTWPIKHPYWVTGYSGDAINGELRYAIVVAYADDEAEIKRLWPDAKNLDSEPAEKYLFTSRFPRPEWLKKAES